MGEFLGWDRVKGFGFRGGEEKMGVLVLKGERVNSEGMGGGVVVVKWRIVEGLRGV